MCEGIATQLRFQHFARPGGREASFFDVQNMGQVFKGCRLNNPCVHCDSPPPISTTFPSAVLLNCPFERTDARSLFLLRGSAFEPPATPRRTLHILAPLRCVAHIGD